MSLWTQWGPSWIVSLDDTRSRDVLVTGGGQAVTSEVLYWVEVPSTIWILSGTNPESVWIFPGATNPSFRFQLWRREDLAFSGWKILLRTKQEFRRGVLAGFPARSLFLDRSWMEPEDDVVLERISRISLSLSLPSRLFGCQRQRELFVMSTGLTE